MGEKVTYFGGYSECSKLQEDIVSNLVKYYKAPHFNYVLVFFRKK